ncbi:MAG: cytochrome c oxidase assembly protein [Candidatus Dormibacteria bacterium]
MSAVYVLAWLKTVLTTGDDVSPWFRTQTWRPVYFAAGVLTAFIALLSPIDRAGDEYLFSMHMLQHLLLMMVAPPLLILGIAGMRPLPPDRFVVMRRVWWLLTRPWIALIVFNVVMLVWHIPALYDTTLTDLPVHIIEHVSFIAVGLVFWWPIIDPIRGGDMRLVSPLERIAVLVVSGIPPTVLGLIFALSPTAYYGFYVIAPRLWGIAAVSDQQYGGVLMLGLGNIIYFVAITIIFVRLLGDAASDEQEAAAQLSRGRRAAPGGGSKPPSHTMYGVSSQAVTPAPAPVGAPIEGGSR